MKCLLNQPLLQMHILIHDSKDKSKTRKNKGRIIFKLLLNIFLKANSAAKLQNQVFTRR